MKITIVDPKEELVKHLQEVFENVPEVEAVVGRIESFRAEAIVSPANSFGYMDGGVDEAITDMLGRRAQTNLQDIIKEKYHGELPVGCSIVVELKNNTFDYLIASPTMRLPMNVSQTLNAYLAFRSTILAAKEFNIKSLITPAFATGIGKMSYDKAALQMKVAWLNATSPAEIKDFESIHLLNRRMHNPDVW